MCKHIMAPPYVDQLVDDPLNAITVSYMNTDQTRHHFLTAHVFCSVLRTIEKLIMEKRSPSRKAAPLWEKRAKERVGVPLKSRRKRITRRKMILGLNTIISMPTTIWRRKKNPYLKNLTCVKLQLRVVIP